jgi:hypothetical protein
VYTPTATIVASMGFAKKYYIDKTPQCPPVTVYPARRKSSAKSFSICAAASNGIGFKCA